MPLLLLLAGSLVEDFEASACVPYPKRQTFEIRKVIIGVDLPTFSSFQCGRTNSPSQPARTKAASAKVFPTSILPLLLYLVNKVAGVLSSRNHLSLIQSLIKEPECRYSFNNYHNGKPPLLCSAIYLTVSAA